MATMNNVITILDSVAYKIIQNYSTVNKELQNNFSDFPILYYLLVTRNKTNDPYLVEYLHKRMIDYRELSMCTIPKLFPSRFPMLFLDKIPAITELFPIEYEWDRIEEKSWSDEINQQLCHSICNDLQITKQDLVGTE